MRFLWKVHERLLSKTDNSLLAPLFRLLGSVYLALLSNGLFQLVIPETCFNKPLYSNELFSLNILMFRRQW
jgi:hypothetical protein